MKERWNSEIGWKGMEDIMINEKGDRLYKGKTKHVEHIRPHKLGNKWT